MGTWAPGPGAASGADRFTGDGTAEIADGLASNDRLNGGLDADTLDGGDDADTFVFNSAIGGGNIDTI